MESPGAATAEATASIVTYREYQRRSGFAHAVQLGPTDEVIVVSVQAPVVVHAGPPPSTARTYKSYEVGFDRRTGLVLGRTCLGGPMSRTGAGERRRRPPG